MPDVVIQMHINGRSFAHHTFNGHEVLVHPVEIFFFIPYVAVHLFLKGFQFLDVQLLLCLGDGLGHLGVAAEVDFLGIIRTAGKGRIDGHQVHLDPLLLQISAGRDALSTDDQVAILVFSHGLLFFHLVQGHPTL